MSERRRYTQRQKATAVIAAEMASVTAAAEQTGIPRKTIAYWADSEEFAELRRKTREENAAGYKVLAHMAQARLKDLIPTMEPRDLVTLMGVAADKGELLSGHATERTETREITAEFNDGEREALQGWLHQLARERADAPGA